MSELNIKLKDGDNVLYPQTTLKNIIDLTAGDNITINNDTISATDTWRGIQDNLTSTSTTDSLSANQGKILNDGLSDLKDALDNYGLESIWDGKYLLGKAVNGTSGQIVTSAYYACSENAIAVKSGDTISNQISGGINGVGLVFFNSSGTVCGEYTATNTVVTVPSNATTMKFNLYNASGAITSYEADVKNFKLYKNNAISDIKTSLDSQGLNNLAVGNTALLRQGYLALDNGSYHSNNTDYVCTLYPIDATLANKFTVTTDRTCTSIYAVFYNDNTFINCPLIGTNTNTATVTVPSGANRIYFDFEDYGKNISPSNFGGFNVFGDSYLYSNLGDVKAEIDNKLKWVSGAVNWVGGSTYVVGDFILYQNVMYRCIANNSSSTAPTSRIGQYWEVISVESINNDLGDVKTSLSDVKADISTLDSSSTSQYASNIAYKQIGSLLFFSGYFLGNGSTSKKIVPAGQGVVNVRRVTDANIESYFVDNGNIVGWNGVTDRIFTNNISYQVSGVLKV